MSLPVPCDGKLTHSDRLPKEPGRPGSIASVIPHIISARWRERREGSGIEPPYQNRHLPVRTGGGQVRRRACSRLRLSLPRMPEAHGKRLCRPGALAGRMRHRHRRDQNLGANCRQRPPRTLSILPAVRIDRGLCGRRMARRNGGAAGRLRRSGVPGTALLGIRASDAPLGRNPGGRGRAFIEPKFGAIAGSKAARAKRATPLKSAGIVLQPEMPLAANLDAGTLVRCCRTGRTNPARCS